MSSDYIEIGASPSDEPCAQVGEENYFANARAECSRYIRLLDNMFGPLRKELGLDETLNYFTRKAFPHDFGTYYEVVVRFDDEDDKSISFAYFVESHSPLTWNEDHVYTLAEFNAKDDDPEYDDADAGHPG